MVYICRSKWGDIGLVLRSPRLSKLYPRPLYRCIGYNKNTLIINVRQWKCTKQLSLAVNWYFIIRGDLQNISPALTVSSTFTYITKKNYAIIFVSNVSRLLNLRQGKHDNGRRTHFIKYIYYSFMPYDNVSSTYAYLKACGCTCAFFSCLFVCVRINVIQNSLSPQSIDYWLDLNEKIFDFF